MESFTNLRFRPRGGSDSIGEVIINLIPDWGSARLKIAVDEIVPKKSSNFHRLQQLSTRSRHLIETEYVENRGLR